MFSSVFWLHCSKVDKYTGLMFSMWAVPCASLVLHMLKTNHSLTCFAGSELGLSVPLKTEPSVSKPQMAICARIHGFLI